MLSESQTQRAVYCVIPFKWHSEKDKVYGGKQISGCQGQGEEEGLDDKKGKRQLLG